MLFRLFVCVAIAVDLSGCGNKSNTNAPTQTAQPSVTNTDATAPMGDNKSSPASNGAPSGKGSASGFSPDPFTPNSVPSGPGALGVLTSAKDKYHVASLLGRGAQGEVYLARRESDNQAVAIKKVRAGDPAVKDELAALKAMKGLPGFPEVFDEFYANGGDHIVMTRVGRTIESIRKKGGVYHSLPEPLVGSIGIQMVDRMETVHKAGFVHRDLYHYNAAMGLDGDKFKIVLIDFGVSRPIDGGRGRKTDVKSLAHSMLTLLVQTKFKKHIGQTPLEEVCKGVHPNVLKLFRYAYETLGELETPDYDMLRTLLRELAPGYNGLIQLE